MRRAISALIAAIAVVTAGTAPTRACGFTACSPCSTRANPCATTYAPAQSYVPAYLDTPSYVARGCTGGCGLTTFDRLADPEAAYYAGRSKQYYYVDQGPTYTGPGAFAPHPIYRDGVVSGDAVYPHYPYHWRRHYAFYPHRHSLRYGYVPHHHGWRYSYWRGSRVLRR